MAGAHVGDLPGPTSSHLWRAVAADRRGAGIGARARDVAALRVAAGPRGVPSRAVAGWRWRLLRRRLLLGSPVVAASGVGVVVIPAVVTPAVLVVATTSTAVETCIGEAGERPRCSQFGTLRSRAVLGTAVAPV